MLEHVLLDIPFLPKEYSAEHAQLDAVEQIQS